MWVVLPNGVAGKENSGFKWVGSSSGSSRMRQKMKLICTCLGRRPPADPAGFISCLILEYPDLVSCRDLRSGIVRGCETLDVEAKAAMPPKKPCEPVAFKDEVQVHGWKCIVNARDGKVNVGTAGTGEFKCWYYRLPIGCPMMRAAQCVALKNEMTREGGRGRGPLPAEDDYDYEDRGAHAHAAAPTPTHAAAPAMGDEDSQSRGEVEDCLGLEHDVLAECIAFEADTPDDVRYPRRRRVPVQQFSPSKGWSEYERERTGSRHDRTREVSYAQSRQNEAELTDALECERTARQRLEERQQCLKEVARQLQGIVNQAAGELNRQTVSTLQLALMELLDEEHEADELADELGASGEREESVTFETAARVSGVVGRTVVGSEELLWGEASAREPTVRVALATVTNVSAKRVQLTPFSRVERCIVESSVPTYFDFSSDAEGRALCEEFRAAVEDAAAAAAIAAADAAAAADATNAADATDAATATATASKKERPLTERQRAGAELRGQLQEVVRLRNKNKTNEAAAALDAIPAGKMTTGAPGRSRELRDTTFTFGGLALTRDIVARFLRAPEVRLLLPEEFQKKQQRTNDAEVERRLLDAAKAFFRDLMKVKGKTGAAATQTYTSGQ